MFFRDFSVNQFKFTLKVNFLNYITEDISVRFQAN